MRGPLSRVLCLAGGLLAAGCGDYGSYHLIWEFEDGSAQAGCGLHGVDSIRVTGTNDQGDGDDATTLCAAGKFVHSVPVGTWTLTVRQIDVRGLPIPLVDAQGYPLPDPTRMVAVAKDVETVVEPSRPVVLAVRPACSDRIDNDGDGRVDLDDPECGGSSSTTTEDADQAGLLSSM
jgi:hypothetical protein